MIFSDHPIAQTSHIGLIRDLPLQCALGVPSDGGVTLEGEEEEEEKDQGQG